MANILIVEDDKFLQDLYLELLTSENYQVDVADDGEAALEKMNHNEYDLVLLDIMLPKKDGLTVLKELPEDRKPKVGQIVMLTNLGQEAVVQEGFSLGAVGHLVKSALAPDQVLTEVGRFLAHEKA
jgi:DNA-binding response OmpR family regulator